MNDNFVKLLIFGGLFAFALTLLLLYIPKKPKKSKKKKTSRTQLPAAKPSFPKMKKLEELPKPQVMTVDTVENAYIHRQVLEIVDKDVAGTVKIVREWLKQRVRPPR